MATRVNLNRERRMVKIDTELRRLGINKTLAEYSFAEKRYFLGAWLPERHLPTVVAACVLNITMDPRGQNVLFAQLAQKLADGNTGKRKATKQDTPADADMRLRGVYFDLLRYMQMVGAVSLLDTAEVEDDAIQSED